MRTKEIKVAIPATIEQAIQRLHDIRREELELRIEAQPLKALIAKEDRK